MRPSLPAVIFSEGSKNLYTLRELHIQSLRGWLRELYLPLSPAAFTIDILLFAIVTTGHLMKIGNENGFAAMHRIFLFRLYIKEHHMG